MNVYILRWNPAISSYKMKAHLDIVSHVKKGQFPMGFDWSVREWEQLKVNDMFILLQVGTDNDGIAMVGKFCSEAYEDDSWRKDGKTIHYADMQIFDAFDLATETNMRAENFEKDIYIKWHGGHSGELLKEDVATALVEKIKAANKDSKRWEGSALEDFIKQEIEILINSMDNASELSLEEFHEEVKKYLHIYIYYNDVEYAATCGEDHNYWCFYKDDEEIGDVEGFENAFNYKFIDGKSINELYYDIRDDIAFM